jgi:cyclomaltodextrinase
MNYVFARACLAFFVGEDLLQSEVARTGYHSIDPLGPAEFAKEIDRLLGLYPRQVTEAQFNLLGSHDTPRFKTLARGDDSAYELATLFQMTFPGAPCIYYGDEIGMEGNHDPGCRGGFPWDERAWNHRLREHVRRSIALRRGHPALRRGDFTWLSASEGPLAYGRRLPEETIVVVLNQSREPAALDINVTGYLQEGAHLRDLWQGGTVGVSQGCVQGLQVGPRSWRVLESTGGVEP